MLYILSLDQRYLKHKFATTNVATYAFIECKIHANKAKGLAYLFSRINWNIYFDMIWIDFDIDLKSINKIKLYTYYLNQHFCLYVDSIICISMKTREVKNDQIILQLQPDSGLTKNPKVTEEFHNVVAE